MPRTVSIGTSSFEKLRVNNAFYYKVQNAPSESVASGGVIRIDKTDFIRRWWDSPYNVTAVMRPHCFGKTLTIDMVKCFFSAKYAERADLFEGLSVWKDERFHSLQGAYPVLHLSFAEVKEEAFKEARKNICSLIQELYLENDFLLEGKLLDDHEKVQFKNVSEDMTVRTASASLRKLTEYLSRYYGKNVIVLLDEYDTPLQEAYTHGYWRQLTNFLCRLFLDTFEDNPCLERGLITGITRTAEDSVFSGLNNLDIITTFSDRYADCFGFTQDEVNAALSEFGLTDQTDALKLWYDGYAFGHHEHIYNPWSITNFLDRRKPDSYWVDTGGNSLISKMIEQGSKEVKTACGDLLAGKNIRKSVDEQIAYSRLGFDDEALWSLLLAGGYLKVFDTEITDPTKENQPKRSLMLTNGEVRRMFRYMVRSWFANDEISSAYKNFLRAMMNGDTESMTRNLNRITRSAYCSFDVKGKDPERFYYGLALGLMVSLDKEYIFWPNHESEEGQLNIIIEPKRKAQNNSAFILEFKNREKKKEKRLEETVRNALNQIKDEQYDRELLDKGFSKKQIRKYGFGFDGKVVLVG